MTKKESIFSKEANEITLTARERRGLRERIISYMEYHPLRMPSALPRTRPFDQRVKGIATMLGVSALRGRLLVAALVLFVVAVPLFAEQSLPGDALYPVKVRFNEGVRSQLLFSPYKKMQWETQRVERRIAEARLLVQEGRLTEETANTIEETVRAHAETAKQQLAEIRENDALGAAVAEVTLESALDVQSAVLNTELGLASSTGQQTGDVSGLAAIVRETRDTVASSTDASADTDSYGPLIARVEENTARMRALSDTLAQALAEAQKAEIQERVITLDETVQAGKDAHTAGNNADAAIHLRDALATTEKLIAFMSSLDLRSSVSLDALVPQRTTNQATSTPPEGQISEQVSEQGRDGFGEATTSTTSTTTLEQIKHTDTLSN